MWKLTEEFGQPWFLIVVLVRNTSRVEKDKYYHHPVEELRLDPSTHGHAEALLASPEALADAFVFHFRV